MKVQRLVIGHPHCKVHWEPRPEFRDVKSQNMRFCFVFERTFIQPTTAVDCHWSEIWKNITNSNKYIHETISLGCRLMVERSWDG